MFDCIKKTNEKIFGWIALESIFTFRGMKISLYLTMVITIIGTIFFGGEIIVGIFIGNIAMQYFLTFLISLIIVFIVIYSMELFGNCDFD